VYLRTKQILAQYPGVKEVLDKTLKIHRSVKKAIKILAMNNFTAQPK
jgi:hypothetical protein